MAKTEQELKLDWAIERMNKSVATAIVSILNGITKMVDESVADTILSLNSKYSEEIRQEIADRGHGGSKHLGPNFDNTCPQCKVG